MLGEYIGSLMAPWRRINRIEFGAALTVLSMPGLVLMMLGAMSSASGLMGGFQAVSQLAQGGSVENIDNMESALSLSKEANRGSVENAMNLVQGAANPPANGAPLINIPALINALCLMILYPFVRGRLLDMGYALRMATLLAAVVQISVLNDALAALVGASRGPLPMGWAFGLFTFAAYIWLTVAGSRARKVHDRGPSKHSQLDDDFPPP